MKKPPKGAAAYGSYHSADGKVQVTAYAPTTSKYRLTVRGAVHLKCLPSGQPGRTTVSDVSVQELAGKLELKGGQSTVPGTSVLVAGSTFVTAGRLNLKLVVSNYSGQGARGDLCGGQLQLVVLKTGAR